MQRKAAKWHKKYQMYIQITRHRGASERDIRRRALYRVAQNAVHLLRCPLVRDRSGGTIEQAERDP